MPHIGHEELDNTIRSGGGLDTMSPFDGIPDSTDWLNTPLSALMPLESALRCQVCKDFFNTPMITSCSHTFCSLCIRRYLAQEGRCPACRADDQEVRLRRNGTVEELVATFTQSRDTLLEFAKNAPLRATDEYLESLGPSKRRRLDSSATNGEGRRSTRSQSRRNILSTPQAQPRMTEDEVPDSDGSSYGELEKQSEHFAATRDARPEDGLVSCPGCGKRMKAELVYAHLDNCQSGANPSAQSRDQDNYPQTSISYTMPTTKPKDRLPTLAYSMLNDTALRRKLKELGIANTGPKPLLQKRHTEWVNLWNANCDSRNPRSKRELLSSLDTWERTQGRQAINPLGPTGVMAKDFDGEGWARDNKSDFDDLILKARQQRMAKAATAATVADTEDAEKEENLTPLLARILSTDSEMLPDEQVVVDASEAPSQLPPREPRDVTSEVRPPAELSNNQGVSAGSIKT